MQRRDQIDLSHFNGSAGHVKTLGGRLILGNDQAAQSKWWTIPMRPKVGWRT
jgi:hypothetical protein